MNDTSLPKDIPRNQYHPAVTKVLQKSALAAIEQHGTLVAAAKALNIDPHTISRWCKKNPEYARKVAEAKIHCDTYHIADEIKQSFRERAVAGKEDGSSAIIGMFLMKKIDPSYRENAVVNLTVAGPAAIQMNFGASKQIAQADTQADGTTT